MTDNDLMRQMFTIANDSVISHNNNHNFNKSNISFLLSFIFTFVANRTEIIFLINRYHPRCKQIKIKIKY